MLLLLWPSVGLVSEWISLDDFPLPHTSHRFGWLRQLSHIFFGRCADPSIYEAISTESNTLIIFLQTIKSPDYGLKWAMGRFAANSWLFWKDHRFNQRILMEWSGSIRVGVRAPCKSNCIIELSNCVVMLNIICYIMVLSCIDTVQVILVYFCDRINVNRQTQL